MARHFAPPAHKKKLNIQLPSFRVPELPKLFKREKIHYKPKRYQRVFSVQEMFLVIAATLLFMAGILLPVPRLISVLIYAAAAILAFLPRIFQIPEIFSESTSAPFLPSITTQLAVLYRSFSHSASQAVPWPVGRRSIREIRAGPLSGITAPARHTSEPSALYFTP
jgi:hypothetical protein